MYKIFTNNSVFLNISVIIININFSKKNEKNII